MTLFFLRYSKTSILVQIWEITTKIDLIKGNKLHLDVKSAVEKHVQKRRMLYCFSISQRKTCKMVRLLRSPIDFILFDLNLCSSIKMKQMFLLLLVVSVAWHVTKIANKNYSSWTWSSLSKLVKNVKPNRNKGVSFLHLQSF